MHGSTTRLTRDAGSNGMAVRLSDIALASAALICVAPVMLLVAMASRVDRKLSAASGRDPRTTRLATLLYKSGLAELPRLLDVVRGRISLVAGGAVPRRVHVDKADAPQASWQRSSSIPGHDLKARHEVVQVTNALQDIGRNFRNAFLARATAEFDDLLRAIDRGIPAGASMKAI